MGRVTSKDGTTIAFDQSGQGPGGVYRRAGWRRKMAARLTPMISRNRSRNCLSMASACSECVRMAEKSLELLQASGPPELITMAEESLELFKAGKAYRESP